MFDTEAYLRRIGVPQTPAAPDLPTLRLLHTRHLSALPYTIDPRDFDDGVNLVDLDEEELFEKSVLGGRGGTCFQLNRMFHRLLRELGYDVSLLAASTAEGLVNYGTDIEHMFCRVVIDGQEWLADVGYPGPSYTEPLRVDDTVQEQNGSQFRLRHHGDRIAVQRRGRVTRWSVVYTFELKARQWDDWHVLEDRARERRPTGPLPDKQGVLCGRAFASGQVVLKGRRYLIVRDGREQVRTVVDDAEHEQLALQILAGEFTGPPAP